GSDASAPYAYVVPTRVGAGDQALTLAAVATDTQGKQTRSGDVHVSLGSDDQRPVVSIVGPVVTQTQAGQDLADVVEQTQVVVKVSGYDNVGVTQLELQGIRSSGSGFV